MRTDTDIRDLARDSEASRHENVPHGSPSEPVGSRPREITVASAAPRLTADGLAAEAYMTRLGVQVGLLEVTSPAAAVGRLAAGAADIAFLPIETTLAGSLNEVYDLLRECDAYIVDEQTHAVDWCLAGPRDVPLSTLRRVLSDAPAIAQCSAFLNGLPHARAIPCADSMQAARLAAEVDNPHQAAICTPEAAVAYGLTVLQQSVGNEPEYLVRYVAIARTPATIEPGVAAKTSLILSVRHEDGSLLRCVQTLAEHRINLTKVETRARPERPSEYLIFVDLEGSVAEPRIASAIEQLRAEVIYLKVLGSYATTATA